MTYDKQMFLLAVLFWICYNITHNSKACTNVKICLVSCSHVSKYLFSTNKTAIAVISGIPSNWCRAILCETILMLSVLFKVIRGHRFNCIFRFNAFLYKWDNYSEWVQEWQEGIPVSSLSSAVHCWLADWKRAAELYHGYSKDKFDCVEIGSAHTKVWKQVLGRFLYPF